MNARAKKIPANIAEAEAEGGNVSAGNESGSVENPRPNKEATKATTTKQSEGTQGGVFNKSLPATKVLNTPLGIQPKKNTPIGGKGTTTSRENIEATRRAMQDKLKQNPVWKI